MNERELISQIGVSQPVLDYFNSAFGAISDKSLFFRYRAGQERPCPVYYFPTSLNDACWIFGQSNSALIAKVIVCTSPLEAVCWFHFSHMSFLNTDHLLFLAVGNIPSIHFYELTRGMLKSKKFELVFGGDLLGRICDITVATRIIGKECSIKLGNTDQVLIEYKGAQFSFAEEKLTLNSFETATGMRSGIRTYKPKMHTTFFSQLMSL